MQWRALAPGPHRPAVVLAACLPLLAMGVLLLCREPVSRRMYTRLCKAHPSLTAPVQMRITGTEVEWTMPGEKPDQCEIHAVYPMAMFGAVFETGRLFAFAIPEHRYAAAAQAGTAGERTAPAAGNAAKHRLL